MTRTRVNRRSPPPPKMAVFKGEARDDWIAFQVQFDKNTSTYEWSNEEKLSKLVEFLRVNTVITAVYTNVNAIHTTL